MRPDWLEAKELKQFPQAIPFVVGAFGRYPFMCCSLPPKFSNTNDFMLFSRTNEKQPIRSSNGIMRQNPPKKSGILMPIGFLGGMQEKVLLSRKGLT